jgi:CubicO group peptidase (beta-lactamase class C family)
MFKLAALLSSFFIVAIAQAAPPRDLSPLLDPIIAKHDVPGMVAALIDADSILAIGASGVRRRGDAAKITIDDRFHIGSCTKAMTATLCATLVEEGKLSWNRTLLQAFPDLKSKMHEQYRPVTLEQLLTNRAGMPGDIMHDEVWSKLWAYRGPPMGSRKLLLESIVINAPEAPPGSKYIYSNTGFSIAGHMAERAMNKSWEQLIQEKLFKPLQMKTSGFGAPGWSKFVGLHLARQKLLKPETFQKLHTPNGDYAMGWLVTKRGWAKGPVLTHAGTNTMWYAVVWAAPQDNFAVLVMCNQGGDKAAKACDEAASAIILARK